MPVQSPSSKTAPDSILILTTGHAFYLKTAQCKAPLSALNEKVSVYMLHLAATKERTSFLIPWVISTGAGSTTHHRQQ